MSEGGADLLGFVLLRPGALAWTLASLLVAAFAAYGLARRRRERARLVAPRHARRFLPEFAESRAIARALLAVLAVGLLAVASSGPVRGFSEVALRRRGLDLVCCLDTSRSMLVRDLRPDRLTRARREIAGLIDRLQGDRVALVAFAGEARDVAPLTDDRTTLRALLERVSPADNTQGGTDLGAALSRALELFDGRTGAHEAIVVVTDGEDLEGRGLEVARAAAERGIRIYVVGMGTETGGKIPTVGSDGSERFVTDESGAEVVSALGGAGLAEIAAVSGGEFLPATRSATPLEDLYVHRISKLERRELEGGFERIPHDRYQWFLALAFACMAVEVGLRERRAPRAGGAR